MERQTEATDRSWLVKSGDRILGPFTTEEVKQNLEKKEIVALDEIMGPCKRWRYLREEPLLMRVLEELRKAQMAVREDTEIGTEINTDIKTISQLSGTKDTDRRARAADISDEFTLTPTVAPPDAASPRERPAQDSSQAPPSASAISRARESAPRSRVPSTPASQSPRTVDPGRDGPLRSQVRRTRVAIWAASLALVGAGVFAFIKQQGRPSQSGAGAMKTTQQALRSFELGRFDEASRRFSESESLGTLDPTTALKHGVLLARNGQTNEAKRRIEPVLAASSGRTNADAHVAQGFALLMERNQRGASDEFAAALKSDPLNTAALINSAGLAISGGDAHGAVRILKTVPMNADSMPLAKLLLGRAEELIEPSSTRAIETLSALAKRAGDFAQEAHVALAAAYLKRGDRQQARREIGEAVSSDPFQTDMHWHDPAIATGPTSWTEWLLGECKRLADDTSLGADDATRALYIVCKVKVGSVADAMELAKDLIKRAPNEPLAHSVNAYVLMSQGESPPESFLKIALDKAELAGDDRSKALAQALSGHACWRRNDFECAQASFAKANRAYPSSSTRVMSAWARLKNGAPYQSIRSEIDAVAVVSPNLIPLREMRFALEGAR